MTEPDRQPEQEPAPEPKPDVVLGLTVYAEAEVIPGKPKEEQE